MDNPPVSPSASGSPVPSLRCSTVDGGAWEKSAEGPEMGGGLIWLAAALGCEEESRVGAPGGPHSWSLVVCGGNGAPRRETRVPGWSFVSGGGGLGKSQQRPKLCTVELQEVSPGIRAQVVLELRPWLSPKCLLLSETVVR